MPALPLAAPVAARPVSSGPERELLRARLVADDRATTALAAQSRLEAICSSLTTQLLSWLGDKKLVPVVGQVFPLADFREAFKTMQTRAALGKMVVRIG